MPKDPSWFDKNVVAFPFPGIQMVRNKDGEWKKQFKPPPEWPHFTRSCRQTRFETDADRYKGTMVLAGEKSGVTILDFDDMKVYEEMRVKFPWLERQTRVRSRRGVHVYCKYNCNVFQPRGEQGLKIDVQGGGGKKASTAIAPPTTYEYEDEDGTSHTFKYKWENIGPLDDIPDEIIAYLNPPVEGPIRCTTRADTAYSDTPPDEAKGDRLHSKVARKGGGVRLL